MLKFSTLTLNWSFWKLAPSTAPIYQTSPILKKQRLFWWLRENYLWGIGQSICWLIRARLKRNFWSWWIWKPPSRTFSLAKSYSEITVWEYSSKMMLKLCCFLKRWANFFTASSSSIIWFFECKKELWSKYQILRRGKNWRIIWGIIMSISWTPIRFQGRSSLSLRTLTIWKAQEWVRDSLSSCPESKARSVRGTLKRTPLWVPTRKIKIWAIRSWWKRLWWQTPSSTKCQGRPPYQHLLFTWKKRNL